MTKPHFLYRLRDGAGRLMYVGITQNVSKRMGEHRWEKHWWPVVVDIQVEEHEDKASARTAEKVALEDERPALNILDSADRSAWKAEGLGLKTIGVDPRPWTAAMRIAHARGESLNDVLRDAVVRYVAEHESVLDDEVA